MPFKEGVSEERVAWFRQLVDAVKNLDGQIDSGAITPDEAFEALDKVMDGMTENPPTKAAKAAVGTKSAA